MSSAIQNHLSVYLGKNDADGYRRFFSNGLMLHLCITAIVLILSCLVSSIILVLAKHFVDPMLVSLLLCISGVTTALTVFSSPYVAVLISHIRLDIIAATTTGCAIVNALLVLLVISSGSGLIGLAIVTLVTGSIGNFILIRAAIKEHPSIAFDRSCLNRGDMKALVRYGGKTFAAQICDVLRFKLDAVIVGSLVSVKMVTHYTIANKLVTTSNDFSMKILAVLNPLFARYVGLNDNERIRRLYVLSLKFTSAFSWLIFMTLIFAGKSFIELWLGPGFRDSFLPMVFLASAFFVARIQAPSISLFYATNTHHYFTYMSLFEGVVNVALSVLFVVRYDMGIAGVALGTLIPMCFTKLIIQPYIVERIGAISLRDYYLLILKSSAVATIIYGICYLLLYFVQIQSYTHIVLWLLLMVCAFGLHLCLSLNPMERTVIVQLAKEFVASSPIVKTRQPK